MIRIDRDKKKKAVLSLAKTSDMNFCNDFDAQSDFVKNFVTKILSVGAILILSLL